MRVHIDIYVRVRYVLVHIKWGFNNVESIKARKKEKSRSLGDKRKNPSNSEGRQDYFHRTMQPEY